MANMANRSPQALREQTSKNTHATVASLLYQEPQVRTVLDLPCGERAFTARILERGYATRPEKSTVSCSVLIRLGATMTTASACASLSASPAIAGSNVEAQPITPTTSAAATVFADSAHP